jgi:peptidoglycan hydrolase-like protein with peptidoglycan-binding domain
MGTRFEEPVEISWNDLANFSISGGFNGCYESDQAVIVSGKGYKPNIMRPLGIYVRDGSADSGEHLGAFRYTLVYSRFIQISEQGAFEASIPITSFPEERFCLVVPIEEAPEYGGHEGFFTVPGVECYTICCFERDLYLAEPRLEGRDVAAIQKGLRDLGYVEVGPIDGVFGPKTESAVFLFQRANQLAENGMVDERTRHVLLSDGAYPRPFERDLYLTDPWMSGNDVAAVQQRLTDLGYTEVGAVDGRFGPKTKSAVLLFQEANRLTEDGVVDQKVWQVLFSEDTIAKR